MFVPRLGPSFSEDQARAAVASSKSIAEALRRLGLRAAGGNHRTLKKYIAKWGIPTDHFELKGRRGGGTTAQPLEEVLVEHSRYHRNHLKERLYRAGIKQRCCELCGQGELWRGRRMSLILDHVNGVWDDNRLENLRIVCANCNATFDTHCGRQNRRPRRRRACKRCSQLFMPRFKDQRYCSRDCGQRWDRRGRPIPGARRAKRPPYEQLRREIAESSFLAVGRRYGVSDNAIRKWLRAYEREREEAENTDADDLKAA